MATWNLKEAGGKLPTLGTQTPYEASDSWMSLQTKAKSMLPKAVEGKWGGYMEGKMTFLPGEACQESRLSWQPKQ